MTHIPIYELAFIWGVGPRVEEPGINLVRSFAYSAPLEDVKLKRPLTDARSPPSEIHDCRR